MSDATEVKVWDPLIRVFHWALVLAFTIAYATGEDETAVHEWAGYTVMALIGIRVVWGFVGTRYARFSDFVRGPRAILAYTRRFVRRRAERHLGHNPLGGAMIVVLLASLSVTTLSGWMLEQKSGGEVAAVTGGSSVPAAHAAEIRQESGHNDDALEEVHELFANVTLVLVFFHIAGVVLSSFLHRENLIRAMFTGRKRS